MTEPDFAVMSRDELIEEVQRLRIVTEATTRAKNGLVDSLAEVRSQLSELQAHTSRLEDRHAESLDDMQAICQRDGLGIAGQPVKPLIVAGYEKLTADVKQLRAVIESTHDGTKYAHGLRRQAEKERDAARAEATKLRETLIDAGLHPDEKGEAR